MTGSQLSLCLDTFLEGLLFAGEWPPSTLDDNFWQLRSLTYWLHLKIMLPVSSISQFLV